MRFRALPLLKVWGGPFKLQILKLCKFMWALQARAQGPEPRHVLQSLINTIPYTICIP